MGDTEPRCDGSQIGEGRGKTVMGLRQVQSWVWTGGQSNGWGGGYRRSGVREQAGRSGGKLCPLFGNVQDHGRTYEEGGQIDGR